MCAGQLLQRVDPPSDADDRPARLGQGERTGGSDARAGTGDESDLRSI